MKNKYVLTIDAGTVAGSYCFIYNDMIQSIQKIEGIVPENLFKFIYESPETMKIIIEKPPLSMGRNTGIASVKLHSQYQRILGCVIDGYGRKVEEVTPRVWQKPYKLPKGCKGDARKTALWEIAKELYPKEKIFKYAADSVLLWDWYRNGGSE